MTDEPIVPAMTHDPLLRDEPKVPEHFVRHLGMMRQWIDGFEASGKTGPANKDTLRQIQIWLRDLL